MAEERAKLRKPIHELMAEEDAMLYYNRVGFFVDPAIGRWISDDPLGFLSPEEKAALKLPPTPPASE